MRNANRAADSTQCASSPASCSRAREPDEMTGAIYVSRHGVRSPYPPGGTGWPTHGQSWEAWTSAPVKRATEFGMTDHAFKTQELTAHGKTLVHKCASSPGALRPRARPGHRRRARDRL